MPVAAVAREPGSFDTEYCTDLAAAKRGEQLLEPRSMDTRTRTTEVIVDYRHVGPARLASTIRKPVLAQLALAVVLNLIER